MLFAKMFIGKRNLEDLSDYFRTGDGNKRIDVFFHALEKAEELNSGMEIKAVQVRHFYVLR